MKKIAEHTLNLKTIIDIGYEIFDFEYPFFDPDYKPIFEQHFIDEFLFDEIGFETPALFKHRLKVKFNTIMPYWNKMFESDRLEQRILDNYDVTESYDRTYENTGSSSGNFTNKNGIIDTPVDSKFNITDTEYYSNIAKELGENTTTANSNHVEHWVRKMSGNIGVQTDSDAIIKYWQSLRKIEKEIFEECSSLFMEVY